MSSQEKPIKVTDKRMFTPEGQLREEYRFLDEKATAAADDASPSPAVETPAAQPPEPSPPPVPEPASPLLELPGEPPGMGATFYDLVSVLAEPVSIYLGDVDLPTGESAENLEMARLHIDVLDVLREKTAGNLTAQEKAFLDDLLYRMRVRYVQKSR